MISIRREHPSAVRRALAVILAAAALTACGDDGDDGANGDGAAPADRSTGQELFVGGTTPTCGSCHVLEDAGTDGTSGPSLDDVQPTAEEVRNAISSGPGVMPALDAQLSAEEIDTLSEYVANAAG